MSNWIKWEIGLHEKEEVIAMSERLGMDRFAVAGRLMTVWGWFGNNTVDGNASSVTKAFLNEQVGVTDFCEAMSEVGWLKLGVDGKICISNWDRHMSKGAKSRALTALRVEIHRNTPKETNPKCNDPSVTSALPDKIRIDKKITTTTKKQIVAVVDPDEVQEAVRAKLMYVGVVGKTVKELASLAHVTVERIEQVHREVRGMTGLTNPIGLIVEKLRSPSVDPIMPDHGYQGVNMPSRKEVAQRLADGKILAQESRQRQTQKTALKTWYRGLPKAEQETLAEQSRKAIDPKIAKFVPLDAGPLASSIWRAELYKLYETKKGVRV